MYEAFEEDVDLEIDLVVANSPYTGVNDDMLDEGNL